MVLPSTLTDLLSEWRADPACGVANSSDAGVLACSASYLARAAKSPEAETAASLLKLECDGMVQGDTGSCGPGRMPLISVTAQHQIHIFIFSVSVPRVVMCCVSLARRDGPGAEPAWLLTWAHRLPAWCSYSGALVRAGSQAARAMQTDPTLYLPPPAACPTRRWP